MAAAAIACIVSRMEALYQKLDIHKAMLVVDDHAELIAQRLLDASFPVTVAATRCDVARALEDVRYRLVVTTPPVFAEFVGALASEWPRSCNLVAVACFRRPPCAAEMHDVWASARLSYSCDGSYVFVSLTPA